MLAGQPRFNCQYSGALQIVAAIRRILRSDCILLVLQSAAANKGLVCVLNRADVYTDRFNEYLSLVLLCAAILC